MVAVSKTPLSTPFYIAKSINAFEDTCVNVEFKEVVGGQLAFAKVMSGEADFGTSSDSVLAFQSLTNKAFVTHAMFVQSDNDVKLLTRSIDKINTAADLKGTRIGVTKQTASEYFISTLLALQGLTARDVQLIHYEPESMIDGLVNEEVDAIVPWEPFAFHSTQLLKEEIRIHDTKNLNTLSFNLVSKKADDLIVEKAKCVLEGLNKAINFISSNPKKSKRIVMDELNLSTSFIDWVWPDYIFKLSLNQSLILNIRSQALWAMESATEEVNNRVVFSNLVDSRALSQVYPEAVHIPQ